MSISTTAFIFARGGSKGVAGKNIRPLAGKPLIGYAVEEALKSQYIERVVVSTDSQDIAAAATAAGAQVPFMRPAELATDESPEWLSWQHAITQTRAFYGQESCPLFVSVPATCPLREVADIDRCIEKLLAEPETDMVITTTASHSNPYFTMVTLADDGSVAIAARPEKPIARRQDAPRVMDIVGVAYAVRPEFVLRASGMWDGKVKAVEVPVCNAADIDTEHDFLVADLLMRHRLGMI
jgi:N-acylneuraminate cytidylyltransferase